MRVLIIEKVDPEERNLRIGKLVRYRRKQLGAHRLASKVLGPASSPANRHYQKWLKAGFVIDAHRTGGDARRKKLGSMTLRMWNKRDRSKKEGLLGRASSAIVVHDAKSRTKRIKKHK